MSAGPTPEAPRPSPHRADWYPDPTRRYEFRYHNGQDWTGDVSVDGSRFLDPLPRPAAAATPSTTPSTTPSAAPSTTPSSWPTTPAVVAVDGRPTVESGRSGRATAALVLGIGSVVTGWVPFVFVVSAVAAVVGLVFGIGVLRRIRRDNVVDSPSRSFAVAGVVLAPIGLAMCVLGTWLTVLAYREVDEFTNIGDFDLRETSCTVNAGVANYTGTITNRSDDERDYHLTIQFLRADTGSVLYRSSTDVDDVAPGDTATWSASEVVSHDELDCRVDQVSGPLPFDQS